MGNIDESGQLGRMILEVFSNHGDSMIPMSPQPNNKHLPVTCLSGRDGIGMANPNLTRRRSYNQSKCLYLWLTDRLVFCKRNTTLNFDRHLQIAT